MSISYSQVSLASSQSEEFLKAYKVLHKGKAYDYSHLNNYLLRPYLDYEKLKRNLKKTSDQSLVNFMTSNKNTWLAENLTTDLLKSLAKQKKWRTLLHFYKSGKGGTKAQCYGLEAQVRTSNGQTLKNALNKSVKLWLSKNSRPDACNPLFSLLKEKGQLTEAIVWQRITLAMNGGRTSLARSLAKRSKNKSLVSLWIKVRGNPSKYLSNKRLRKNTSRNRQVVAYGIKRLARKSTEQARKKWATAQKNYSFSMKQKGSVESYMGVRDAQDHSPYAVQKLSVIPANLRSEDAKLWMARMAIRQADWNNVLNAIQSMSPQLKRKDIWQYWQAHAEKQTKRKVTINLQKLATDASFYGFLAADELNRPYVKLLKQEPNWDKEIPRIKRIPAMQRAAELFRIGKPKLAKKEWFWALKPLNKHEKLVAAAYAHQLNQPFTAIVTVSQTKDWNQTGLRFPLKYRDLVEKSAKQQGIDPAWAYGIMRRESAFDPKVISSAKAQGLMQVLPRTAREVVRNMGIKGHRTSHLLIPAKNARIGTGYLSQMLERFKGNHIKATASYNAGPHRIPRWQPDFPITAPQWIESIPFNETRNYVRAVLSYTTIYDHKLNYKNRTNLRLSQRLQKVDPE